jgi:hypothetical protein
LLLLLLYTVPEEKQKYERERERAAEKKNAIVFATVHDRSVRDEHRVLIHINCPVHETQENYAGIHRAQALE